ncbi:uncharacterized protein LOC133799720 [Humulus lupulus]|uniref:uncharacterized protein LOC133799720 n=1 Tax=Humulus lupulus TaxID=3486 RepID=UPI002B4185AA|nr:uncharacterized protein LOC133799720 [Humulus lupulus]
MVRPRTRSSITHGETPSGDLPAAATRPENDHVHGDTTTSTLPHVHQESMATETPHERAPPVPEHINTRPRLQVEDTPYFLSSANHPNLILTTSLLTGPNYQSWKRGISVSLAAKNKTAFVDGSLPRPLPTDPYLSHWLRCNNMVISWILHSVSPNIAESIMFCTNAMWKDLSDRFNRCNGPRVFQLRESAIALKQGNQDILTGLNESYHPVRAQILLLDPIPNISKVFSMVIQEESQRTLGSTTVHSSSTIAAATAPSTQYHPPRSKKPRPFCTHCNRPCHLIDKCYFLHGFPPGYGAPRNPQEKLKAVANIASTTTKDSDPSLFCSLNI